MLESLEQLEKEIETFHQNVVASNELQKLIFEQIKQNKKLEKDFSASSARLAEKIEESINNMQGNNKTVIDELIHIINSQTTDIATQSNGLVEKLDGIPGAVENRNQSLRNDVVSAVRNLSEGMGVLLDQFKSANATILAVELQKFKVEQDKYVSELLTVEKTLSECKTEIESKYSAFLSKLESTNMDQLYRMCKEMKESFNKKFMLLSGGVGVIIIILAVSMLLK